MYSLMEQDISLASDAISPRGGRPDLADGNPTGSAEPVNAVLELATEGL